MGFPEDKVILALTKSNNALDGAMTYLLDEDLVKKTIILFAITYLLYI